MFKKFKEFLLKFPKQCIPKEEIDKLPFQPPIFYKDYLYFSIAVGASSFFKYHRDVYWEMFEERRAKAEFSLMLSLSRKKVDWLSGLKADKYYFMNRDHIVVRGAIWDYEKEGVIGGA